MPWSRHGIVLRVINSTKFYDTTIAEIMLHMKFVSEQLDELQLLIHNIYIVIYTAYLV